MGFISQAIGKSANEFPGLINERAWHNVGSGATTYDWYKGNDYENAYPSITKIVNRFMVIAPFAIDATKELVSNARAVEKLYHPNRQMSSVDFREALAVMYLVHPRTHILVWRLEDGTAQPGGDITAENIVGYTFLENAVETTIAGKTTYSVNGNTYTDQEVITLKGAFPYDLSRGYSATEAAKRWSRIDDYIADYQSGFFKNGAIPAGQFIITAPTPKEFNDIVDMMQRRHRGAGKNNNVTYSHKPVDPNTGKPADAQIEWVPFNVDNKNLDLKSIFLQVNQKIDSAFGVPASIRGVGENNNFATAQMDNRNFVENVIDPLALKIWTRFTHELNRITGGLGYAITYELELPSVSEDEKVQAETKKIQMDTIVAAVAAGFSVDSIIAAIEAPDTFGGLVGGYIPPEAKDDMDVDTGDEVEDSPNGDLLDSFKGEAKSKDPKVTKLADNQVETFESRMARVARRLMEKQINDAVSKTKDAGDPTNAQKQQFIDDAMVVIAEVMTVEGALSYEQGIQILISAGLDASDATGYATTPAQIRAYREYLRGVVDSYSTDTTRAIRTILDMANVQGWTTSQTQTALRNIMNTDEWRVTRIAVSEINRSQDMSSVFAMRNIQSDTGTQIERALMHTGTDEPCEYCKVYIDNWMPVNDIMINKDEVVNGVDGGTIIYNWDTNEGHDVHANGHCVPQYRVVQ